MFFPYHNENIKTQATDFSRSSQRRESSRISSPQPGSPGSQWCQWGATILRSPSVGAMTLQNSIQVWHMYGICSEIGCFQPNAGKNVAVGCSQFYLQVGEIPYSHLPKPAVRGQLKPKVILPCPHLNESSTSALSDFDLYSPWISLLQLDESSTFAS